MFIVNIYKISPNYFKNGVFSFLKADVANINEHIYTSETEIFLRYFVSFCFKNSL